jgi:hypothetical protein
MKLDDPDNISALVLYCKRFMWIDSDTIKLVNKEGIEKIVDVNKNFEEIQFATVPLFDPKQEYKHYYDFRGSYEIGDTLERLKLKY